MLQKSSCENVESKEKYISNKASLLSLQNTMSREGSRMFNLISAVSGLFQTTFQF